MLYSGKIKKKKRKKKELAYRHQGLRNTGEYSRTQGMNQDLVFCDGQHQQSGCILWAQIQQQRGEAPTTAAQNRKSLLTEAATNGASALADCIFNEVSPTLKEVGRTRVGLATDCHVETAVEDRRRALVQV